MFTQREAMNYTNAIIIMEVGKKQQINLTVPDNAADYAALLYTHM